MPIKKKACTKNSGKNTCVSAYILEKNRVDTG
jgi:hypothetical protein